MKISRTLLQFVCVLTLSASSACWAAMDGWYFGAGLGHARGDFDRTDFIPAATKIKNSDTGFRVFSGYQVNPNFAIEANYSQYGKVEVKDGATSLGSIRSKVVMLNAVGLISTSNRFSVFAKGGVYRTDRNRSSALVFASDKRVKSDDGLTYSLGMQLALSEEVAFNLNFEKLVPVGGNNLNVNDQMFSGNLVYYFG